MGIALVRLPAYGLNLTIYTGHIGRDEMLTFYRGLDPFAPENAYPLLTYMAPDIDLSEVALVTFSELKRVLAPKVKALTEHPHFHCVVVCNSEQCNVITRFWRAYVQRDPTYASPPVFFETLESACAWLQTPPGGCEAARKAVHAVHAEPAPSPRPERVEARSAAPGPP